MKVRLFIMLVLCFVIGKTSGQSLSPSVLSTSGAFYSNGSGMLSSTIGEMTMVQTFATGGSILNQGFQQAFDFSTGINNLTIKSGIHIFPNPSSGNVSVQIPSSFHGEVCASVYDAIGKLVFTKTENLTGQLNTLELSLADMVDGMYLFEVKTTTENYIAKINLVK